MGDRRTTGRAADLGFRRKLRPLRQNPQSNRFARSTGHSACRQSSWRTASHAFKFRALREYDVWVRDIAQTIEGAIARPRPTDGKVTLVGYSLGALRVGRALYAARFPEIVGKVDRVAFSHRSLAGRPPHPRPTSLWCTWIAQRTRCCGRAVPMPRAPLRAQASLTELSLESPGPEAFHSRGGTGRVDHQRDIRRCVGRQVHRRREWCRHGDWNVSQPKARSSGTRCSASVSEPC